MTNHRRIAVLGTGLMGGPMAANLARAGFSVRAWNRTRERAEALVDDGVRAASSPVEAVDGADLVITMLLDGDVVADVMRRAADGLASDTLWLQMSTVGTAADELGRLADELGVAYVDAPVLGTKQPAEQGELVVLAGCPQQLRERVQPVFDVVGSKTVWLDQPGHASRLKLVVNTWIGGLTGVLAETVALADALGVDPRSFLDAIEGGAVGAPYARIKGEMMLSHRYPTSFPVRHVRKDLRLILGAADDAGAELAIARQVAERYAAADDAGHGQDDMAAVREVAGG